MNIYFLYTITYTYGSETNYHEETFKFVNNMHEELKKENFLCICKYLDNKIENVNEDFFNTRYK